MNSFQTPRATPQLGLSALTSQPSSSRLECTRVRHLPLSCSMASGSSLPTRTMSKHAFSEKSSSSKWYPCSTQTVSTEATTVWTRSLRTSIDTTLIQVRKSSPLFGLSKRLSSSKSITKRLCSTLTYTLMRVSAAALCLATRSRASKP